MRVMMLVADEGLLPRSPGLKDHGSGSRCGVCQLFTVDALLDVLADACVSGIP